MPIHERLMDMSDALLVTLTSRASFHELNAAPSFGRRMWTGKSHAGVAGARVAGATGGAGDGACDEVGSPSSRTAASTSSTSPVR